MHRGCPRIPAEAAADDGAPIVRLTEAYPRGRRRWCDKDAFLGNLNGHEPLRYPEHRGHTVALFREPRARLASECAAIHAEFVRAFARGAVQPPRRRLLQRRGKRDGRRRRGTQSAGSSGGAAWRERSVYSQPFLRQFLYSHGLSHRAIGQLAVLWNASRAIAAEDCVQLEGMRGCQTKMVLGVPCAAPFALNTSLLAEAVRRLRDDFRFVGLTDRWDQSICLFHARLGGEPVAAQFLNSRPRGILPSGATPPQQLARAPAVERADGEDDPWHDEWDEALYRAAVARFDLDLALARQAQMTRERRGP